MRQAIEPLARHLPAALEIIMGRNNVRHRYGAQHDVTLLDGSL